MKRVIVAVVILICCIKANAQILNPVKWSYASKKINVTEAVVFIKSTIDPGWHVYSQYVKEGGPVKTTFTFEKSKDYQLIGKTIEPKPITRMEKVFNMEVGFFENSVIFQQKIKLINGKATVKGALGYMTCNDKQCLPPSDESFSISID